MSSGSRTPNRSQSLRILRASSASNAKKTHADIVELERLGVGDRSQRRPMDAGDEHPGDRALCDRQLARTIGTSVMTTPGSLSRRSLS